MTVFPGFTLPEELRLLGDQIRRFIQDEIIPLEQTIDPDAPEIPREDFVRLSAKTKAAGLWTLGAREEYGGGGLDTFSMCVVLEAMAQHRMGLYNPGCGVFGRYPPPAIWAGSKAQIEKYAVPALREGYETFFAITEPSGGSDPAGAIQTRAERRGDKWVLNGRKVFISRAHDAPWGIVFARTDKGKGRGGISCFILEHGTPGFHAKPIRVIRTSAIPNDVSFEDCEIPAENLIGQEGQGLDLAFDLLVKNRFPYSACNLGVATAAHRMAVAHAKQRSTFGAPLSQRQAIQWMLADAEVELRACRWLIWEGAWKADRGEDARVEASIAKLYSSEARAAWSTRRCRSTAATGCRRSFRWSAGTARPACAASGRGRPRCTGWSSRAHCSGKFRSPPWRRSTSSYRRFPPRRRRCATRFAPSSSRSWPSSGPRTGRAPGAASTATSRAAWASAAGSA